MRELDFPEQYFTDESDQMSCLPVKIAFLFDTENA